MDKKNLQERIKQIVWIFLIGTFCYIIFGLIVLSDYSGTVKFDGKKFYDVIKDALTLAAAFLAPVTAVILFSDWRKQHLEKNQESTSSQVYLASERIQLKIRKLAEDFMEAFDRDLNFYEKINHELVKLIELHQELLIMYKNFVATSEESIEFKQLAGQIIRKKIPRVISSIEFEINHQKYIEFPVEMGLHSSKDVDEEELKKIRSSHVVFEQHIGDKLFEIDFGLMDLEKLRDKLVIKTSYDTSI